MTVPNGFPLTKLMAVNTGLARYQLNNAAADNNSNCTTV